LDERHNIYDIPTNFIVKQQNETINIKIPNKTVIRGVKHEAEFREASGWFQLDEKLLRPLLPIKSIK